MKNKYLLIIIGFLILGCKKSDDIVYYEEIEKDVNEINIKITDIINSLILVLQDENASAEIAKKYLEASLTSAVIILKNTNTILKSAKSDSLKIEALSYFKKTSDFLKKSINPLTHESINTYKNNVYIQIGIVENYKMLLKETDVFFNNLKKYRDENEIQKCYLNLDLKKRNVEIENFRSLILNHKESLKPTTKKYRISWYQTLNKDTDESNLFEVYFYNNDKDSIITQQIIYKKGVIDTTISSFNKIELTKKNDIYKGRITVYNNFIYSINQELDSRDLSLLLYDQKNIFKSENKNYIEFTSKTDTITGLIDDMCFFKHDSLGEKLRLIQYKRAVNNKYQTNNPFIESFNLIKN